MLATLLVAVNVTTAVAGGNISVIAETIETLADDEDQDQEDPDTVETVPSTDETETSGSPSPVPAPSQEETAAAAFPVVPTDFDLTAPDGTEISLSGSFPETTTAEVLDFTSDYVANIIAAYDFSLTLPEGTQDPGNPVTITIPFETDKQFAVCEFSDGLTPSILEDFVYEDGILTIELSGLHPVVIAEIMTLDNGIEVSIETIDAVIYEDGTYTTAADDDMQITVSGTLPEGTTAKAYPVDNDDENVIAAYDITLFDIDGNEYQPEFGAVSVTFTGSVIEDAIENNTDLSIEHEDDYGNVDTIDCDITSGDTITFDAESFSLYRVVSVTGATDPDTNTTDLEGKQFYIMGENIYTSNHYQIMTNVPWQRQSNPGRFFMGIDVSGYYDPSTNKINEILSS